VLWSGRFWLLTAIGAMGGVPILVWNWQNGWVTWLHTTETHAGMSEEDKFDWKGPVRYLGTQFLVLLGFWFVAWVRAAWAHHPGREARADVRYLWWMSVPMVAFFLVFSIRNGGGEPNWPIAGYISGMVLTVGWLAHELQKPRPVRRGLTVAGIVVTGTVGLALTIAVHNTALIAPLLELVSGPATPENPMPLRRFDPTCRLRGWHEFGAEVDRLRAQLLRAEGTEPLLAGTSWSLPGEIGFYCEGHPTVYSFGRAGLGDRHSQYDLWHPNPIDDPEQFLGKTFLVIGGGAEKLKAGFKSIEKMHLVTYTEHGQTIAVWGVTIARGFEGFPERPEENGH
jgi:hypothetical protein